MKRLIAIALAAGLVLAASLSFPQSGSPVAGVTSSAAAAATKVCKSRMPNGKTKQWRCGTDQSCCVNHSMGLYVCGFPGLGCL